MKLFLTLFVKIWMALFSLKLVSDWYFETRPSFLRMLTFLIHRWQPINCLSRFLVTWCGTVSNTSKDQLEIWLESNMRNRQFITWARLDLLEDSQHSPTKVFFFLFASIVFRERVVPPKNPPKTRIRLTEDWKILTAKKCAKIIFLTFSSLMHSPFKKYT